MNTTKFSPWLIATPTKCGKDYVFYYVPLKSREGLPTIASELDVLPANTTVYDLSVELRKRGLSNSARLANIMALQLDAQTEDQMH